MITAQDIKAAAKRMGADIVGIIITELELEPDPIIEPGTLCNRCMACVRECPGGCIPADRTIKENVGGYDLECADASAFLPSKKGNKAQISFWAKKEEY